MFGCLAGTAGNKWLECPLVVNSTVSQKPKVNLTLRFAPNSHEAGVAGLRPEPAGLRFPLMPTIFSTRNALLLGVLFFLICFGLGYPILNRYDPGTIGGTSDAAGYCAEVTGPLSIASYRPLVPTLAKAVLLDGEGADRQLESRTLRHVDEPSSLLTAATAVSHHCHWAAVQPLLCNLSRRSGALPGELRRSQLESGWLYRFRRGILPCSCYLVPSLRALVPFAALGHPRRSRQGDLCALLPSSLPLVWWLTERPLRSTKLLWTFALGILGCADRFCFLSFSPTGGFFAGATQLHRHHGLVFPGVGFINALIRCLKAREFWYTFIWLLPLGSSDA